MVSQAWRAATQQLLKTADKPVLQHKPIISPRNVPDGETSLQDFENKKIPATQISSLETINHGRSDPAESRKG